MWTATANPTSVSLVRWVACAIVFPVLATVAFFAVTIYSTIESSDRIAARRQTAGLERVLQMLQNVHALEQIGYSSWPDAYAHVVTLFDPAWLQYNFGREALAYTSVSSWTIVDENNNAVFSSETETAPDPETWKDLRAAAMPAMMKMRSLYAKIYESKGDFRAKLQDKQNPGLYVTDVGVVKGKPVMFAVTAFFNADDGTAPEHARLLIGTHTITSEVLEQIREMVQIENLSIKPAAAEVVPDATTGPTKTLTLRNSANKHVLSIYWTPYLTGHASIRNLVPVLLLSLTVIAGVTGVLTLFMVQMSRRAADNEREAIMASRFDHATGLANRSWFNECTEQTLTEDQMIGGRVRALLLIDCDHFKQINDTLGHAAGDAVIERIGEQLRSLSSDVAVSGRLGGDEFAVLSAPLQDRAAVEDFAIRVSATLSGPLQFEDKTIPVSVTIGAVATNLDTFATRKFLLSEADAALYRAKRTRRGSVSLGGEATALTNDAKAPPATPNLAA